MRKTNFLVMMILIVMSPAILAQTKIENAKKYLEKQIANEVKILIDKNTQQILSADVLEVSKSINLGNYDANKIVSLYFINNKGKLSSFQEVVELIESKAFIDAINPAFSLKTKEDAAKLLSIITTLVNYENGDIKQGKVFKKDEKWCLATSDWFGEVVYYQINTSSEGKITNIKKFEEKLEISKIEIPRIKSNYAGKSETISEADKKLIDNTLKNILKVCSFHLTPLSFNGLPQYLSVFDGNLAVGKMFQNGIAQAENNRFVLVNKGDEYSIINSKEQLLNDEEFMKAIAERYTIKNDADAQKFEVLLNELKPANAEHKKIFKKDNVWCFVRDKSFDDLSGILVLVDKDGKIIYTDNSNNINDRAILQMKMHDPNFKVDYKFKLIEPTKTTLKIGANDEIPVKISFDAKMVNAKGAYIGFFNDGKMSGFAAASNMESPYKGDISGRYFDDGQHTQTYMLMPSGKKDPKKALASVKIEFTVTGGVSKQERQNVDNLIKNILKAVNTNDVQAFSSYCLTKAQLDNILANVKSSSKEAKGFKKDFKNMDTKKLSDKAVEDFKNLNQILAKNKIDASKVAFKAYEREKRELVIPSVKGFSITFIYKTGTNLLGAIKCSILANKKAAYIFEFKPFDEMISEEVYNKRIF